MKAESGKLSNWEVFHHLKNQVSKIEGTLSSFNEEQINISKQIMQYLVNETSASLENLSESDIKACIKKLNEFELTLEEKLQIVNLMPTSLVEIHMIVDSCSLRLTENETLDILSIVQEHLRPVFLHIQHDEVEERTEMLEGENGEASNPLEDVEEEQFVGQVDLF